MADETILRDGVSDGKVLVLSLPSGTGADLAEVRDYVLESLAKGVLVLGNGMRWSLEEFPPLGGVHIVQPDALREKNLRPQTTAGKGRRRAAPVCPAEAQVDDGLEPQETSRQALWRKEKQDALKRLRAYRREHGLGCLEPVAAACGAGIDADYLRSLVSGDVKACIDDWRRIVAALDKLEDVRGEKD